MLKTTRGRPPGPVGSDKTAIRVSATFAPEEITALRDEAKRLQHETGHPHTPQDILRDAMRAAAGRLCGG
jgi:hypothetical protein